MGTLDWTCTEINKIDIKTRKTLAMSGSFHPNSDADRLYFCRRDGGRGIRAIRTIHESRIISIRQHLRNIKDKSEIHEYVYESEANNIVRVGYELLQRSEIEDLASIHDQEIPTKYLINKRQKEAGKETTCNTKCRLRKQYRTC